MKRRIVLCAATVFCLVMLSEPVTSDPIEPVYSESVLPTLLPVSTIESGWGEPDEYGGTKSKLTECPDEYPDEDIDSIGRYPYSIKQQILWLLTKAVFQAPLS